MALPSTLWLTVAVLATPPGLDTLLGLFGFKVQCLRFLCCLLDLHSGSMRGWVVFATAVHVMVQGASWPHTSEPLVAGVGLQRGSMFHTCSDRATAEVSASTAASIRATQACTTKDTRMLSPCKLIHCPFLMHKQAKERHHSQGSLRMQRKCIMIHCSVRRCLRSGITRCIAGVIPRYTWNRTRGPLLRAP